MRRKKYPLLEYDPSLPALIEPGRVIKSIDAPEGCVFCFFQEVINKFTQAGMVKIIAYQQCEDINRPLYEMEIKGERLAVFHPGVGASLAAALLEEIIARGCRKFIACGGAGVLDREVAVGHLIVPTVAVRDEGTSFHYLAPDREVKADPKAIQAIETTLQRNEVSYLLSKTWTTDGPFRETPEKIKLRRAEGCLTVEMETAAFFAVAQFRDVPFGQILYAGDDVSGSTWDQRDWQSHLDVRERLFWLAADACLIL